MPNQRQPKKRIATKPTTAKSTQSNHSHLEYFLSKNLAEFAILIYPSMGVVIIFYSRRIHQFVEIYLNYKRLKEGILCLRKHFSLL
jgi:hypothetical protein